jgi:hypothetical protein
MISYTATDATGHKIASAYGYATQHTKLQGFIIRPPLLTTNKVFTHGIHTYLLLRELKLKLEAWLKLKGAPLRHADADAKKETLHVTPPPSKAHAYKLTVCTRIYLYVQNPEHGEVLMTSNGTLARR